MGAFVRVVASILVWCVVLLCSGCTIWQKELNNRGGYLDYILDEHWFKADSKRMRALRAFAIQVSLARIASVSAKNDTDRQVLAIRIGTLTKKFLPVYACGLKNNPLNIPGAEKDPCFYYDSAMVEYSTGLFDLAMVALPIEDAKNLVNAVTGTAISPIAFTDLLNALLVIARDALNYGRIVGALYRDTVELEVQLWLATPVIDDRPPPYRVTEADVAPLREIYSRGNDDMPAWLSAMAALRSRGLEPLPDPKFFYELAGLMKYICDLITKDPTASTSCKVNLPTTMVPPAPAVGPATPVRIGTTSPTPAPQGGKISVPSQPAKPQPAPGPSPPNPTPATDRAGAILKGYLSNARDDNDRLQRQRQLLSLASDPDVMAAWALATQPGEDFTLTHVLDMTLTKLKGVRHAMLVAARKAPWGGGLPSDDQ